MNNMNREIKFRAWNGERMLRFKLFERPWPFSSEWLVMQFTGLYDKDGWEIYEGDILEVDDSEDKSRCQMIFSNGAFTKQYISDEPVVCEAWMENFDSEWWKVVGNIYENPDLLEAK